VRVRRLHDVPVRFVLGGDHPELVAQADIFFVSPGVPESTPVYRAARAAGLAVQSMTTLFFDLCPGRIVGVTGSSGKTTTTSLIGHILRLAGRDVVVGGNIGDPMLDLLPLIGPETLVVLELSSFQLAILERSPHLSVVTNITPNHLDRHGTMASYIAAKRRIVERQTPEDWAVLNRADGEARAFAGATAARVRWFGPEPGGSPGATTRGDWIGLQGDDFTPIMRVGDIPLPGRHNVENVLAAAAAADLLEVAPDTIAAAVRSFRPAPHRLQTVAEYGGVRYVDDSIATSPARASVALEALDAPLVLIAGGRDKNLPWDDLARLIARKVRALLLIGEAAPLIEDAVRARLSGAPAELSGDRILRCRTLEEAVGRASRLAAPGDVVLLSPGCASYDMFNDFEERGRAFARAVEALHAA